MKEARRRALLAALCSPCQVCTVLFWNDAMQSHDIFALKIGNSEINAADLMHAKVCPQG